VQADACVCAGAGEKVYLHRDIIPMGHQWRKYHT
jgi:hypothetical protein